MIREKPLYMKNRRQWRSWLQKNHDCRDEVWLVYYKKHTNKPSIPYVDAVEEAICFGWIDGKVRSVDAERNVQRYTPRRERSNWSELNIGRARRMIAQGQMTEAGLSVFLTAMKANARVPSSRSFSVPNYLKEALLRNMAAWE